jgi:phage terminase small subunit
MAKRGRRGDPLLQQAMGNPGRRKSKVQKMVDEAERVATLLAKTADAGALTPPALLLDPVRAPALKIWNDHVPELVRTHRLEKLHMLSFAMFCVYAGEWIAACDDIAQKGAWQRVKTVSGSVMERIRPIVQFREIAFANARAFGKEFGLTPREEYALFRDQADAVTKNPGLFGELEMAATQQRHGGDDHGADIPAQSSSLIGTLAALDSAPPSRAN